MLYLNSYLAQEYFTYSKETDENSGFSPTRFNNEHFDTDAMQRHVHFEQSTSGNIGKNNPNQDLKEKIERNIPGDIDRRIEQTHSTELPRETKSHPPNEPQPKLSLSGSRQDNQNLYSESRRISFELPKDDDSQGNEVKIDNVNDVITRNNGRDSHDAKQMSSSFDDKQHAKNDQRLEFLRLEVSMFLFYYNLHVN